MTTFQPVAVPGEPPPADSVRPRDSTAQAPTSVARLNDTIRGFVQTWGSVWVEGEITAFNLRGGNVFGRLKDLAGDATISFRIWSSTRDRLPGDLKVGDHVIACVKADYFVKNGDFGFGVSAMRHVGLGDQLERLERLRVQLRSEGLFDPSRKSALPFLPRLIGLITGENSDAEKDVHRNAELRWPQVRFQTKYAAVQGDRCVPETIAALKALDAAPDVDVIIIARGGGDPQTLLGFSDERLLRAPETLLTTRAHEVELLAARGRDRVDRSLQLHERRTAELRATLRALSPASTLARGYAIAHLADGVIVRDAAQAPASTPVVVTVGRGSFAAHSDGEIAEQPSAAAPPAVDGAAQADPAGRGAPSAAN